MKLLPMSAIIATSLSLMACQSSTALQSSKTTATPAITAANQDSTQGIYQTKLNNGLRIIIKTDARAPIVMTQIWYDVGSSDEPMGKGGMSHFLEHMMFKDAKGINHDDYQRLISHFGGTTNAFTSFDYTAYYESLPANQFPLALQIEANRMKNLLLTVDEAATEKQVIKEERRLRTDDNPLAKAYEIFNLMAQPDAPQGRPIIGSMDDIDGLSLEDLQNWYRTWYAPNNAVLVLVGDVTPDQAMPWVHKYFDALTPSTLPERVSLSQPSHRGYQNATTEQAVQVPSLLMGFNVPSLGSKHNAQDAYALSLFSDVADGGLSARFETNLIRKKNLLNSVGISYSMVGRGDELFTIQATPKDGVSLEQAEAAILEELQNISQGEISDDELKRGQTNLVSGLIFGNDSVANQAVSLGALASQGLPIDTYDTLPAKLAAISKADIQRAGKAYLTRDNLTTLYIVPQAK